MKTIKNIITGEYSRVSNELALELVELSNFKEYKYAKKGALKSIRNKARKIENNLAVLNYKRFKNSVSKRFIHGKNFAKSIWIKTKLFKGQQIECKTIRVVNFGKA